MSYLYGDSESWEVVEQHSAGCLYRGYGTGTIEERLASLEDIDRYAGKSSAWIESIPHILANSRESFIRR